MKKIKIIIILLLLFSVTNAQQDAMFTHYMYNTQWVNPAYAGTREALTITGINRSQWVGYDGAPVDQSFTMNMPIAQNKAGIGLSILNDKIGPAKNTLLALDFSYHVRLDRKSKLSFGLKGLIDFYRNNMALLNVSQQNDAAFAQNINQISNNLGAGLYYHHDRFYIGISTPRLIEYKAQSGMVQEKRHFYFITGALFPMNDDIIFKPTLFLKETMGAPIQADLTGSFVIKSKYNVGLMYRTGDALGILLGYSVSEKLYLGYSFDWSVMNTTGKYNSGSHEIMFRYDIKMNLKPRSNSNYKLYEKF